MQIEPYSTIPLLYQIVVPSDTTLYYVRAVVRDTSTGTTLSTQNLTRVSSATQRYTGTAQAPQDGSGSGKHIDVTITVYSGYTTASENYERIVDKYLVKASPRSFGGAGGSDIDYEKIAKIFNELIIPIKDELAKDKITPLEKKLGKIAKTVEAISSQMEADAAAEMPETPEKPMDFSPVLAAITHHSNIIVQKIDDKEVPEMPNLDEALAPVLSKLEENSNKVTEIGTKVDSQEQKITEAVTGTIEKAAKVNSDKTKRMTEIAKELSGLASNEVPFAAPARRRRIATPRPCRR